MSFCFIFMLIGVLLLLAKPESAKWFYSSGKSCLSRRNSNISGVALYDFLSAYGVAPFLFFIT
jgi:hypothetical protein